MPLQVLPVATALATRPSGSSPNASAISLHRRPKPAAVCAPIRRVNSSDPSEKRPSASICHMKRSGCCARRRVARRAMTARWRGRIRLPVTRKPRSPVPLPPRAGALAHRQRLRHWEKVRPDQRQDPASRLPPALRSARLRHGFDLGHVELQHRLQVDICFERLLDDVPGGRRLGSLWAGSANSSISANSAGASPDSAGRS